MSLESKICTGCDTLKPISCFSKNRTRKDGFNGECRECLKSYQQRNKEKVKQNNKSYKVKNALVIKGKRVIYEKENRFKITQKLKERKLKNRYGMTLAGYNLLLGLQEGLCAICGKQNTVEKPLHVDHNHKTGKVRGLLCGSCNRGLGILGDSMVILENAIIYLKEND